MKILIVSKHFYPKNSPRAFRTTELAKELGRQNHKVTVYTHRVEPQHKQIEKEFNLIIRDIGERKFFTPKFMLLGQNNILERGINRILEISIDYPSIEYLFKIPRALSKENGYDLLISIAVPHTTHWGVAKAIRRNPTLTRVWIADCGDPYLNVESDSFQKAFYFKFVERWWGKIADYITVPIENAILAYEKTLQNKINVIPQGFKFSRESEEYNRDNLIPTFAYGGTLIPNKRDPRPFLDTLLKLGKEYKFHVFTKNNDLLLPYIEKAGGRIILEPMVPREDFLQRIRKMDFVVNFENIGTQQSPSKLIDYAIINKPILSIKSTDNYEQVLLEFLEGNYKNQYKISDIDKYKIENVVAQFLSLAKSNS